VEGLEGLSLHVTHGSETRGGEEFFRHSHSWIHECLNLNTQLFQENSISVRTEHKQSRSLQNLLTSGSPWACTEDEVSHELLLALLRIRELLGREGGCHGAAVPRPLLTVTMSTTTVNPDRPLVPLPSRPSSETTRATSSYHAQGDAVAGNGPAPEE
jgi:hypothetical protein